MTGLIVLILVLTVFLVALVIFIRRFDARYEGKKTKDIMSGEMKALIEGERKLNKVKKDKFESILKEASSTTKIT